MKKLLIYSFISLFLFSCAGAYYYAERYTIDMSRAELIDKIQQFKKENPVYQPMVVENGELIEYPQDHQREYFYTFYFYLPEKEMIVHSVTNISDQVREKPANFSLTAITKNKNLGGGKRINTKDLSRKENKEIKKMFEEEILDKLGKWERD